jgi:DNA-binding SARP family transcriptional activator
MMDERTLVAPSGLQEPMLRISLFGPFQIAWEGQNIPFPRERLQGRGVAPALGLLKALLCCPHRFATRDWLMEQFWPDTPQSKAEERLNDVASGLRTLLRPAGSQAKILHYVHGTSSSGYRLEGYPPIWVDADAFTWYMQQAAMLERYGEDSLPFLETAYQFGTRGTLLAEDLYSPWAVERRRMIDGLYRQCVHQVARHYRQHGAIAEAELRLRVYWQAHLTDEDALRPLLELLGEQERFQEAEEYYQQLLAALVQEGEERQPAAQTQDLREFLRAKQIQRKRVEPVATSHVVLDERYYPLLYKEERGPVPLFSSGMMLLMKGEIGDWASWFGLKLVQLISLVDYWQGQAVYCDQLQALIDQEIVLFDIMRPQNSSEAYMLSRRQLLISLAALPTCTSILQGTTSTLVIEKFLTQCAGSITACWHLLKGSELLTVEQTLSTYVMALVILVKQSPHYRKIAARLASQAYRLYGIVALHRNNLKAREHYCQKALYFSELSGNVSLLVSAHTSLASTFYYGKDPLQATLTYQKALIYADDVSPLQRSRLHAELAVVYAQQKHEQAALQALELAQTMYPDHPEADPSFLYADFSPASLIMEAGLTHVALAQHFQGRGYEQQAWQSFAQIEDLQRGNTAPQRIFFEIANHQAGTALVLGDLDLWETYLKIGIEGVKLLGSKQRLSEVADVFSQGQSAWPHEQRVKHMEALVHDAVATLTT